ncbi:hypothetical protein XH86_29215 [Bradyrhizobium guangdongense]|uniref:Uncharacterized protein n=1 Tax=Bradyrhizobium guangdongense TaxID=1325090 RepID=A0ABX6ULW4_9BRAD|nr:hypothetical protein X265_29180 [Bradyrhizobium guangdongense]QOZ62366.1 hypothetical protein XH86_29215 [Bradyrhizobium guangdongense]
MIVSSSQRELRLHTPPRTRACSGIGSRLPLPLAGEGWGEGVPATGQSPRGKNPHPPRAGRCFASPEAWRPLPQAGEAEQTRRQCS